jgi:2,3-bisphosphoglycerate-independent phosphoglycerate mutase
MQFRKIVLVLADGLGDRLSRRLERRTPLQAASTPSLDELTHTSSLGLLYPIAPGIAPGSDTSHLAIFGFDPYIYYKGRGPFEALGAGLELKPGDVAFRGNFAHVDHNLVVVDRRAGRSLNEASELAEFLNQNLSFDDVEVLIRQTTEHRFALVLRGKGLSPDVTDTDPHRTGVRLAEAKPVSSSQAAVKTAEVLNRLTQLAYRSLNQHPLNLKREEKGLLKANAILLRGAGTLSDMPSFEQTYGLKGFAVTGTAMIRGFCRMIGLEAPFVQGATGDSNTNVDAKARTGLRALGENDFLYVHFKATDAAGHDKNPEMKVRMVEKFDQLIGQLLNGLTGEEVICITGDHCTPVDLGEHSADPVPLLISSPDSYGDGEKFTEVGCAFGSLGRLKGLELMRVLMNQANRISKFGE